MPAPTTIALLALAIVTAPATLDSQIRPSPDSARPTVVLVELFTSEGCSSCPPADALLREVDRTSTAAGQLIVGISEHVTYWNSLGWSDPFSSSIYTDRQNGYGRRFGLDSVYTPQMVVNGADQFVGSDKNGLARAIARQPARSSPLLLRITSVESTATGISFGYSATGNIPSGGAEIVAVLADDADRSSVLRGENSGRTLAHVSVARSLTRVATLTAPREETVHLPLPPSFRPGTGHHLILFAQVLDFGRILDADSRPL